jgi:hypothetical protein
MWDYSGALVHPQAQHVTAQPPSLTSYMALYAVKILGCVWFDR